MLLQKLKIENLRSYDKGEISFPKGSTLLSGDIGTGKTTILLAIEFALFGLQPGQKGTSILRNVSDHGRVILECIIDGKEVVIERTLKRTKKSVSQDYTSISIDGEKFEGAVTEVKSKILDLLNYPTEFAKKTNILYKFTVYTPQEEMKQIILESGDIRLNTLRHVFGIDKYKRITENISILVSRLREKIRINEGIIFDLEENKKELREKKNNLIVLKEKQVELIKKYEEAMELSSIKEKSLKEIEEKINTKKSLENERDKSNVLIKEKQQQINNIQGNIKNLKLQIEEARKISFNEEEYKALNDRIRFQENKEEELQKEYVNIVSNINLDEARKNELNELKEKISYLEKCPTCLQEVLDEYKKNIIQKTDSEIQKSQERLNELLLKKNQLIKKIESVKNAKEGFKKRKSDLELLKVRLENLKEKEQRMNELIKEEEFSSKEVKNLQLNVDKLTRSIEDYLKYDSDFNQRNRELIESKKEVNEAAIRKAEINKEIQFSEESIDEKQINIQKKGELKKKTERFKEVEYWISEKFLNLILFTEKQVMMTLKGEFSNLFSKWFSMLVSETLTARLDDEFSPIIEQQDYELDYSFLSGGERTAIALAYRLALNQVINSLMSNIRTMGIVILDEPTDGFSAQQLEKMRDVLSQLNTEQLILVSHEEKIEGFVDNIIRFTKEEGLTKIA